MRWHVAFLVSLVFGAGCARSSLVTSLEEGAACLEDGDCGDGMRCIDSACRVVTDCSTSEDCASDQSCQGGFCVANDACTEAADCPPDQTCVDGRCTRMGACSDDTTCPPEAHCEDGACVHNPACTGDDQCPDDQHCGDAGLCERNTTCQDDGDCPLTQACIDGVCSRNDACTDNGDCPIDQHCGDSGVCERNDPCTGNNDCPIDQHCQAGVCERNGVCADHDDCPADQACVDNVCVRHAGCREDVDCDDALWCTGRDVCSITLGCLIEDVPVLDDRIACTVDRCDEGTDRVVHEPDDSACDDGELCTNDRCDGTLGCQNEANDATLPPQLAGDCRTAVCSAGHVVQTPNDGDLPSDDGIACTQVTCQAGNLNVQYNHASCADNNACTNDQCTANGCINFNDNTLLPPQGSSTDCYKQICDTGAIRTVADDTESPPQISSQDCKREICQGGSVISQADNAESLPQVANNDCKRQVCQGGAPATVDDDGETPPQLAPDDCKVEICLGGVVTSIDNDGETPPQASATDCHTDVCLGGLDWIPDSTEVPPQTATDDCKRQVCSANGTVGLANNDSETPPQNAADDCKREICLSGSPVSEWTDAETPPQASTTDCRSDVCTASGISWAANDLETPPQDTLACTDHICSGGAAQVVAHDERCTATWCQGEAYCDTNAQTGGCKTRNPPVCALTNSECFTNPRCDNTLHCIQDRINVDGDATPKCGADDIWQGGTYGSDDDCADSNALRNRALSESNDGIDNDCDGYIDEGLSTMNCAAKSHAPVPPVLFEPVTLTVPVAIDSDDANLRMSWSLISDPAGGNSSLALSGVSTNAVTFEPVLFGDYTLRLTMSHPDPTVPDQVCPYAINIPPPTDELNVTMIMSASNVDMDLHLLGPVGGSWAWGHAWDYAEQNYYYGTNWWCPYGDDTVIDNEVPYWICDSYGSNAATALRDCHWSGCNACKVVVPGQAACVLPTFPTNWGVATYGNEDPTLDVDNRRGCYADGSRTVCTPESISVPVPSRAIPLGNNQRYTVAVHYFGSDGGADTTVKVRMYCKTASGQQTTMVNSPTMHPGDWWFVRDFQWEGAGCTGIVAPTRANACGAVGGLSCAY
ncbi:MAG: hypothetical protein ABIJ09_15555 [Pseudomonadota bacterium]